MTRVPPVSPSSGSLASRKKRGLIGQEKGERKCLNSLTPGLGRVRGLHLQF